jgi:hypothetical protein
MIFAFIGFAGASCFRSIRSKNHHSREKRTTAFCSREHFSPLVLFMVPTWHFGGRCLTASGDSTKGRVPGPVSVAVIIRMRWASALWAGIAGAYDPRPTVYHHHKRNVCPARRGEQANGVDPESPTGCAGLRLTRIAVQQHSERRRSFHTRVAPSLAAALEGCRLPRHASHASSFAPNCRGTATSSRVSK